MSFQEKLLDVIKAGLKEVEQDEREGWEFDGQWKDFRKTVVVGLFQDAVAVFEKKSNIGADFSQPNGSIVLEAGFNHENRSFRHRLSFKPDKAKRQVVCKSSCEEAPETFTLDALTREVVEDQITQFAYAVAGGKQRPMPRPSVYDERLKAGKPVLETF